MLFKDRRQAGEKLAAILKHDNVVSQNHKNIIIVSLLRGGVVVGKTIAENLQVKHLPLIVTKISAPNNIELAIGALCYDTIYLDKKTR